MNFLADENVESPIVAMLRQTGHDVLHMAEITTHTIDDMLLAQANAEGRILPTNDKDYGELVFLQKKVSAGIILMRFVSEKSLIKSRFVESLLQSHGHSLYGFFTVVSEAKIRRRPL